MKVIPLKKTVDKWSEEQYGIRYFGKRSFGYNTEGIVYINSEGKTTVPDSASSEIIGYFVSVYVPAKINITPVRYNLTDGSNNNITAEPSQDFQLNNQEDEFYLSKLVGYRILISDCALGSRFYSLYGTTDGGRTWEIINNDPFNGTLGCAAKLTFLNDNLGFLCLSRSAGDWGQLYRTEDGGKSYKEVSFPEVKVTLSDTETYNPFDVPEKPYEKDGILNVLIGQGTDGDYNGGIKALYQSKDKGLTWQFIKEDGEQERLE